jgi:YbbR domain-containing protein
MMISLKRNLGYKILSLALGILLYAVAFAQQNPRTSGDVYVQPDVVNIPQDMAVKSQPPGAMVSVSGPIAAVQAFRAQSIKAVVDLSDGKAGRNTVPIRYRTEATGVVVSGPQNMSVTLEKRRKDSWTVDALFDLTPPPGYSYAAVVEPRRVVVTGLTSDVLQVSRVVAIVNAPDSGSAISQTVDVVAQNNKNQIIDTVTIDPPRVKVTLNLRATPVQKTLLLSANITGTPAPGYAIVGYSFDPSSVTVSGMQTLLADRSSLTVPVDVAGLSQSTTRTVTVPMPAGLTPENGKAVRATVRFEVRPVTIVSPPTPIPSASPATESSPTPPAKPPVSGKESPRDE